MAVPSLTLGEPLTRARIPSLARGQVLGLLSFLIGLGCAVFLFRGEQVAAMAPSISMAANPMQLGNLRVTTQPRMSPAHASKVLASLPGSPALKHAAIRAIEANNGRCVRDVSLKAEIGQEALPKDKILDMPGITAPMGLFDPLGISANVPEGRLLFYREAELKHGRVCMIAVLGLIVGDRHDFIPLLGGNIDKDVPAYLFGTPFLQQTGAGQFWPALLAAVGFEEWRRTYFNKQDVLNLQQPSDPAPGDYGWDPLGLKPKDAKAFKALQNKELNNGRLAMFAAAGIIAQEQVTGKSIFR